MLNMEAGLLTEDASSVLHRLSVGSLLSNIIFVLVLFLVFFRSDFVH